MATTTAHERIPPLGQAAASNGGNLAVVRREWQRPRYQAPALTRLAITMAPIALGVDRLLFAVVVAWPNHLASLIERRRPQHVPRGRSRDPRRPQPRSHPALWPLLRRRPARRQQPPHPHLVQPSSRPHARQEAEVENIVRALRGYRVLTRPWLVEVCRAAHWPNSGFRRALAQAVSTGKIKRLGNDLYEIAEPPIR